LIAITRALESKINDGRIVINKSAKTAHIHVLAENEDIANIEVELHCLGIYDILVIIGDPNVDLSDAIIT